MTTAGQTTTTTYLYGETGHPVAMAVSVPGTSTVFTLPIFTDVRGSVMKVGGRSGLLTYTYDPYGQPLASMVSSAPGLPPEIVQAIAAAQPLRYAGYVLDAESGLYYCSQRYYDPVTAQFISRDAIGADAQESAYQYCGGDPIGKTDPSGMRAIWSETGGTTFDAVANDYAHAKAAKRKALLARVRREEQKERDRQRARDRARAAAKKAANDREIAALRREAAKQQEIANLALGGAILVIAVGAAILGPEILGLIPEIAAAGGGGVLVVEELTEKGGDAAADAVNCFVRGTPVLTAAGLVPIDALKPGTLVLTGDPATGITAYRPVLRTMVHKATELVHVRVAGETITCTPNHPFWVVGKGWTSAGELAAGDSLQLASGQRADITSFTREKLGVPVDVYNIEVADYHTYFVASAGVWVHNCGGEAPEVGTKVFRAWGGDSGPFGKSWTNVDPRTVADFRGAA